MLIINRINPSKIHYFILVNHFHTFCTHFNTVFSKILMPNSNKNNLLHTYLLIVLRIYRKTNLENAEIYKKKYVNSFHTLRKIYYLIH